MLDLIIKRCRCPTAARTSTSASPRAASRRWSRRRPRPRAASTRPAAVSFVDAHFHMDSTLSFGLPRVNQSGTLLEGIASGANKPLLTQEAWSACATGPWSAAFRISSTMQDGAESVRLLCELAERGLRDMHCDESDDPLSRHVETLAYHAQRLGLQGRVTART